MREDWFWERFGTDLVPSLRNFFLGYLIAGALGIVLGTVLGRIALLADVLHPLLELLRALPGVALVPVALLLLGPTDVMRVALIAFGSMWVVLLNTLDAVRGMDPILDDVSRVFRLGRRFRITNVVVPAASPQIITGLRNALSIALVIMIVSEFLASSRGIGFAILEYQRSYQIVRMWAAMIVLAAIGYLINLGFAQLERRILHWHAATRDSKGTTQ